MPSLHPCPYCGAEMAVVATGYGGFQPMCPECGFSGAVAPTEEDAARLWNLWCRKRLCTNCRKARAVAHQRRMNKYLSLKRKQVNPKNSDN